MEETKTQNDPALWKRYLKAAIGHANAAKIVNRELTKQEKVATDSTWIALHHLIGLAVECSLKSYLSIAGKKQRDLRTKELRHNLNNLLEISLDFGLEADCKGFCPREPDLLQAIKDLAFEISYDYEVFNYRYIGGEKLKLLDGASARDVSILAVEHLNDIVKMKGQNGIRTTLLR